MTESISGPDDYKYHWLSPVGRRIAADMSDGEETE